jgi:serine/threonine-protein kinase
MPDPNDTLSDEVPTLIEEGSTTVNVAPPAPQRSGPMPFEEHGFASRYTQRKVLGRGGMGEVRLCSDARIGRDVAMKVMKASTGGSTGLRERFEREARLQGQLEHPAIVPVYDLGLARDGAWFTMKRVRGYTLERIVRGLADEEAKFVEKYTLRRLLVAFVQVTQAIAFAHSRGVVHRDLKPANIMLGDFGEVYVLDWGLAKVFGAGELPGSTFDVSSASGSGPSAPARAGEAMGTPGYMAPEQVRGEVHRIDERTDVYALGAILFEILTLERLHGGATVPELYATTLHGADARASTRAPLRDVPPELEAVCLRATRLDPEERFPSARELHEAVERYLEGDRDLARRREIARAHAEEAVRWEAIAAAGEAGAGAARQAALREAGAALTLDPEQRDALAILARLLLGAPKEIPAEARRELDDASHVVERASARSGVTLYLGWLLFVPVLLILGVRNWVPFIAGAVLIAVTLALAALSLRGRWARAGGFAAFVGGSALVAIGSTVLGPHILMPNLALSNVLAFTLFGERTLRVPAIAIGVLSFVIPWCLQMAGVLPASYRFSDGGFTVIPMMTNLPEWGVHLLMLLANTALVVPIAGYVGRIRDQVGKNEQSLFLQAWSLRQLLPDQVARQAAAAAPLTLGGSSGQ